MLDDASFASTLHHLALYHTEDGVLSIYLDLDPADDAAAREDALTALLEPLHSHTQDPWLQGRLEYEMAGALDAVRSWPEAPARSVAMFFCGPGGLEAVVPLRFPVRSLARFARRPVLSPLIAALESHRRYCVVICERSRARIVSVMLGQVEDEIAVESDRARGSDFRWGDDLDARAHVRQGDLHAHVSRIIEHLWVVDRSRPIHGLILAGDQEAVSVLRQQLPRSLSRAVIEDTLAANMNTIGPDLAHQVERLEQRAREQEDAVLITRLLEEREGDRSVRGWEPTLEAINEGRVQLLLLPGEGARQGVFCAQDHFVALEASGPCPTCGAGLRPTEHVGEAAVRSVLLRNGQVHVLAPAAAATLQRFGAGALLRY
jgi:hypothetical protein